MRLHRFFCDLKLKANQRLELPKPVSHHCLQVLRYSVNDQLILFNGDGYNYLSVIETVQAKSCQVFIQQKQLAENESPLKIHLYQAIAKGEKMDFIVQKSVELAVAEITPIFTQRCNVKIDTNRLAKKIQHWQKVAISASEQCGRAVVTKVNPALALKSIELDEQAVAIYLEPQASENLHSLSELTQLNLFVGPEGGFSQEDLNLFQQLNIKGVRMGNRILRTETAGLAAMAILQANFGDL